MRFCFAVRVFVHRSTKYIGINSRNHFDHVWFNIFDWPLSNPKKNLSVRLPYVLAISVLFVPLIGNSILSIKETTSYNQKYEIFLTIEKT